MVPLRAHANHVVEVRVVISDACSRWFRRCAHYRPAGEVVDVSRYEVALHARHAPLKAFVEEHHYAGTWPATRFAFGLHDRGGEFVGVAAFSVPVRDAVLRPLPIGADAVELGRLVLLDRVPSNAESFFVARCNEVLRREGIAGAVTFADPHPRTNVAGEVVKPGHLGVIYTALSAVYLGPARPHTLLLLPDGRSFNRRTLAKIRRRDRGWRYAVDQLVSAGAGEPWANLDAWMEHTLATLIRREPHPGCLKYALPFDARVRRALPASKPFPKVSRPRCVALAWRCA